MADTPDNPNMREMPVGCAFAARCPTAAERCRQELPPLRDDEPGHRYACWFPVSDRIPVEVGR